MDGSISGPFVYLCPALELRLYKQHDFAEDDDDHGPTVTYTNLNDQLDSDASTVFKLVTVLRGSIAGPGPQ